MESVNSKGKKKTILLIIFSYVFEINMSSFQETILAIFKKSPVTNLKKFKNINFMNKSKKKLLLVY